MQIFLHRESHGQRSLADYSPIGLQRVRHDWNDLAHRHAHVFMNFTGTSDSKESACNMGDSGLSPGSRSPGEENGYPLHYSCLGNSIDRGTWSAYSVFMSVLLFQFISPAINPMSKHPLSMSASLFLQIGLSVLFLYSPHIYVNIQYVFLSFWLHSV